MIVMTHNLVSELDSKTCQQAPFHDYLDILLLSFIFSSVRQGFSVFSFKGSDNTLFESSGV